MQLAGFTFIPRRGPIIITLIVLPILVSLGIWQLNRAEYKLAIQTLLFERLTLPEVSLTPALLKTDVRFRRVKVKGQLMNNNQYLIDNRLEKGQPGYWVITPLLFDGGSTAILVNRGWVPLGNTRTDLPDISVMTDIRQYTGILSQLPGKLFELQQTPADMSTRWPKVIRNVDMDIVSKEIGKPVTTYMLQLDAEHEHAYLQNWRPVAVGPEKSRGYAVQWFSMAFIVLLIFIGLNCRRVETTNPAQREE